MTGLYVREMLSRRLIRRVLIVPPLAWLAIGARNAHPVSPAIPHHQRRGRTSRQPFLGAESDRAIVSIDTLAGERMFNHLKDPQTDAYDLVVFDEAHKLSADRQPDFRVRKTDRYGWQKPYLVLR